MAKSKYLVIVESPGKVKTISKILSKDYQVVASYGHVRDLPKSKIGIDLSTFEGAYEILPTKKKHVDEIKKLAKTAEHVYLCSDFDREGEAIAHHLSEIIDTTKFSRATFTEITAKAIREAIASPRSIDMNLVNSQQARRFLDRIVGYKLSPLLWERVFRGLSAGRVQSVAVRLVAEREREILAFKAEEYWTIEGNFEFAKTKFKADLRLLDGKDIISSAADLEKFKTSPAGRILLDKAKAEEIAKQMLKQSFKVTKYEKKDVTRKAYPPFATSSLQQTAAGVLGFDTKRTMRIAQSLYEGVLVGAETKGLITYMRTDSFAVSKEAADAAETIIKKNYGDKYYPASRNVYASRKGAQEAHECIRPTYVDLKPEDAKSSLSDEQYKLYKLIWDRFVASQMAPAIYESTSCEIESSALPKGLFGTSGRTTKFDGWTKVMRDKEELSSLPTMKIGDLPAINDTKPDQHFTQPPPRYNEASLVKKLEEEGIGRPSTYASIIELIQTRGYVVKTDRGGRAPLKATDIGLVVTDELVGGFPSIMELGYTRELEEELDKIAEGELDYKSALTKFYKEFEKELASAKKRGGATKSGTPTAFNCPKCGKTFNKRLSKYGWYFACSDDKCKHIMSMGEDGLPKEKEGPKSIGLKCDLCGCDVVKATSRFGDYLACANYIKDKSCTFTMKIDKKGNPQRRVIPIVTTEKCVKCGKEMVIRVGRRKAGPNPFLSCSNFPKCRASAELPSTLKKEGEEAVKRWTDAKAKDMKDAVTLRAEKDEE